MSSENLRVSGNSAYVFGTIGETSDGIDRIVGLLVNKTHPEAIKILSYLVNLLKSSDYECLMNAAGTIGTIVSYFFLIAVESLTKSTVVLSFLFSLSLAFKIRCCISSNVTLTLTKELNFRIEISH